MKPDLPMFIHTGKSAGQREDEANAFAADILVPPETAARMPFITSLDDVRVLASEVGVSPGIIVGRLHHERIKPHNWGTALFVRYRFVD